MLRCCRPRNGLVPLLCSTISMLLTVRTPQQVTMHPEPWHRSSIISWNLEILTTSTYVDLDIESQSNSSQLTRATMGSIAPQLKKIIQVGVCTPCLTQSPSSSQRFFRVTLNNVRTGGRHAWRSSTQGSAGRWLFRSNRPNTLRVRRNFSTRCSRREMRLFALVPRASLPGPRRGCQHHRIEVLSGADSHG